MKQSDLITISASDTGGLTEPIAFEDAKIAYVVQHCRNKRVLDLGCVMHDPAARRSRYWLHRAVEAVAHESLGMDLSEEGVRELREEGYNVVVGDAESFVFETPFDTIVAGDIIEHLSNPGGFLQSAAAALAPGGCIVVQTPNPWYWRNIVKSVLAEEVSNNPEHTCWFDPRTLRQLAVRFDLELSGIRFHSRYARDRFMPLPRGVKHTSWSALLRRTNDT